MLKQLRKLLRNKRRQMYSRGLMIESKHRIRRLFIFVMAIVMIHAIAMMIFEGFSFGDALWLSLTTINTTGYGDLSSTTLIGRTSTVILMYGLGITLMAQLATEYVEFRFEKKERKIKGLWSWQKMTEHIVIINTPNSHPRLYLERLCRQLRQTPKFSDLPICIISDKFENGLPLSLLDLNVVHVHGDAREDLVLERANIQTACYVAVISPDSGDIASDSMTLDILFHLHQKKISATIIAEVVKDENRKRFQHLGATAVIRPIRAYPELIVRAMEAPGTERFMENLFGHAGDSALRFDFIFDVEKWSDLACEFIKQGLGTPVGYVHEDGNVSTNPAPLRPASGVAIIILVHQDHIPTQEAIERIIITVQKEKKING